MNSLYRFLLKPILFLFPAEFSHKIVTLFFKIIHLLYPVLKPFSLPRNRMLGIAAGFDKNGEFYRALELLGFGFIEIGTITPKPQNGNEKPRIFRLKKEKAILNRMGFPSVGVEQVRKNILKHTSTLDTMDLGLNIGKNKDTPLSEAHLDYAKCAEVLNDVPGFLVINVSSPNTSGLKSLQSKESLKKILLAVKEKTKKSIYVKVASDLSNEDLISVCELLTQLRCTGIVCANTYPIHEPKYGFGGLSGPILKLRVMEMIKLVYQSFPELDIIGVGGIQHHNDVLDMIQVGARRVEVYTGLIYNGLI